MANNTQQGAASAGAPSVAVDLKGPVWDVDGTLYRPGRGVLMPAALAEALGGGKVGGEPVGGGEAPDATTNTPAAPAPEADAPEAPKPAPAKKPARKGAK